MFRKGNTETAGHKHPVAATNFAAIVGCNHSRVSCFSASWQSVGRRAGGVPVELRVQVIEICNALAPLSRAFAQTRSTRSPCDGRGNTPRWHIGGGFPGYKLLTAKRGCRSARSNDSKNLSMITRDKG